jgi:hypothetical protein
VQFLNNLCIMVFTTMRNPAARSGIRKHLQGGIVGNHPKLKGQIGSFTIPPHD